MNSAYTIQKPSFFKRVVALIFDIICVTFLFVAVENLVSHPIVNAAYNYDELDHKYEEKLVEHGIGYFDEKDGNKFKLNELPEGQTDYDWTSFRKDEDALYYEGMVSNLNLFKITLDALLSELIVFCIVPLILRNGQTLGKKLMHLGLISTNEVKVRSWNVFARYAIGIFALETMISLFFFTFFIFPLPLILSFIFAVSSKRGMALHDYIGGTIVIDMNNTVILDTVEERKKRILEEKEAFKMQQSNKMISQEEIIAENK
ncbi:MAG: RDD family protein [Bacilli bacterium]|nr:RDD family protein [Bacilli bacterium]